MPERTLITEYQYVRTQNIRDTYRVMRGELREEIFACREVGDSTFMWLIQGNVAGEGKV